MVELGAIPEVFDQASSGWAAQAREQLLTLVGPSGYAAARRTTINAHFTDPAYAAVMWEALSELGFEGGQVLESAVDGLGRAGELNERVPLHRGLPGGHTRKIN